MNEYEIDDDLVPENGKYHDRLEVPSSRRISMLASRRRIEDLRELRRVRELLGDDEFNVDFEE